MSAEAKIEEVGPKRPSVDLSARDQKLVRIGELRSWLQQARERLAQIQAEHDRLVSELASERQAAEATPAE
jgi:hypothetical protein